MIYRVTQNGRRIGSIAFDDRVLASVVRDTFRRFVYSDLNPEEPVVDWPTLCASVPIPEGTATGYELRYGVRRYAAAVI
jgi:hypothetical protein